MSPTVTPLPADALVWHVEPQLLDFEHTGQLKPDDRIVGQDLALRAIRQSVEMNSPGYNLFVVGLDGGGSLHTVQRILKALAPRRRRRRDFVYVRSFEDLTRPRLLSFPAGEGPKFARELANLGELLFEEVPGILESDTVRKKRDHLIRDLDKAQREALVSLQKKFQAQGFTIGDASEDDDLQPVVLYVVEEEPRTRSEVHMLALDGQIEDDITELEARFDVLEDELIATMMQARTQVLVTYSQVDEVEWKAIRGGIAPLFAEVGSRFPAAREWLDDLQEAVTDQVEVFRTGDDLEQELRPEDMVLLSAFQARVLHRGGRSAKAPIVMVPDPTFSTLFGGISADGQMTRPPDHTHLRGGALHDADGGYLVLNAADVLMEPGVWKTLKRAMVFGEIGIQNLEGATQGALASMRPDPVPLDVKLVLIGDNELYSYLHATDPDFASVFKMKAEFEEVGDYSDDLPQRIAVFLARMARREKLRPLTSEAVAAIVEWAVRQAGRGGRILLAFGEMTDLAREAEYQAQGEHIERADVLAALAARDERHGRVERRTRDALRRDLIHVATQGRVVGQINGLAVYRTGGHEWGRPLRLTATVGSGRGGIINIERESGLSGKIHNKGMQVLAGLIRGRFGRQRTLALTASLCVEQSYGRIDGDSASSAEVYALLSSLSGLGIDQGRAVTGSVDQLGNIQPIGGVNVKIEGFFQLCKERGLNGQQGVLIPARNAADLNLSPEVVEACAQGRFHIWPIETIEQGLSLLVQGEIGDPASKDWPHTTLYGRVMAELKRLETVNRRAARGEKKAAARKKPRGAE